MCGRFTLTQKMTDVGKLFGCEPLEMAPPRYNIAPTQPIPVIHEQLGKRRLDLMRWGFLPSWVKDPKAFSLIINARSETVTQKASFKSAIRHRRCLIPATGFYEWHRVGDVRTPYYIRPKDGRLVGYAALYETYADAHGNEMDTVCFMTTAASADIADIHHRMPVAVPVEKASIWLDCVNYEPRDVVEFYDNSNDDFYEIIPISDRVNKVANDDADIQTRVSDAARSKAQTPSTSNQLSLF